MSYTKNYLKYRNQQKQQSTTSWQEKTPDAGRDYTSKYLQLRQARIPRQVSRPQTAQQDAQEPDAKERTWFQKGAFEDGFSLGNVGKALLGSATDLGENVGSGLVGMGEKALDALAWLGNAYSKGQYYQNGGGYNVQADKLFEEQHKATTKATEEFIKKDLYDEEKVAKAIIANPMQKLTGIDVEGSSVFGEKSDALAQSGGQLLGTAALQAVGVPWWVTTGATSFGGEAENALNQGATFEEAGLSAAINAGAEILTEKISGGISFGGKTLDNVMLKPFLEGISNKAVRALAQFGIDAVGEGNEELLSGIMSAIGQKLTYMDDRKLSELFTREDAAEAFVGGIVLSSVSNIPKTAGTVKTALSEKAENTTQQPQQALISPEEIIDKIIPAAKTAAPDAQQAAQKAQQGYINDILDEVIAKANNAPADPVGAAVEAFKATGTVTNKQATDILNSVKAVTRIIEETGVKFPDTASGRRAAVKQAIADLAQRSAENKKAGSIATPEPVQADSFTPKATGGTAPLDASLDGGSRGPKVASSGVSSDALDNNIPQSDPNVNPAPYASAAKSLKYKASKVNQAILQLAERVKSGLSSGNEKVQLNPVSDSVAAQIQGLTGINVRGYKVVVEARQIDHILKDHGENGRSDRSMADPSDIARMEYALENPDSIVNSGTTRAYVTNKDGKMKPADTVLYEKQNGDGSYYVVQAVPDTNKKTLYVVTAFIGKSGYKKTEAPQSANANGPGATPKAESAVASDNIVHQTPPEVNPETTAPSSDESVGAAPQNGYGQNTVGSAESRFKHEQRKSQVYAYTFTNATGEAVRGVGEEAQKASPNIGNYDYVSEKESWYNATQRTRSHEEINFEYNDLVNKNGWTGEDNDTAMRVLAYLRKNGDMDRLSKLALKQREQGTIGGQLTQSFAKYTRTPAYAADSAIVELSSMTAKDIPSHFYKGKTLEAWKGEVSTSITDIANQIESVDDGDTESMKDIIRSLANFRHTTAMFGLRSNLTNVAEAALKDIDFQTAKDIATAQLSQIPSDFRKRPVGQVVKTIRIHNMLSSIATVNRNLTGNASIGFVDAVSDSTVGRALDALVSLWTKKRTVGNDVTHAKTYFTAASKAAKMASLCAELDIPMESESGYSTGKTRTYSPQGGPVMRFMSAYEKYMKYALEVTDKFFEGGTNAVVDESLQNLGAKANLSEKEIGQLSEMVGQRRTFKDERSLAQGAKLFKKGLNVFGTKNIGLGDLAMPFVGTGSSVAQTAIDYTGGGVFAGLYEIAKIATDVKNGKQVDAVRQRRAVTNAARSITGVGLVAYCAALAAKGIITVNDDDDKDERALDQALGFSGVQFNVSAWLRDFAGEDTALQDGDWTVGIDFLEPFNAQMCVGYLLSQEDSVQNMVKAYPGTAARGVAQSILDMPMMQNLSDTVDLMSGMSESFAEGDDAATTDALGQLLGNYGTGFIPSWLRQTAYMADPYYRDTTGENAIDKAVNQIKSNIPGLSQTLPKKYSGLGEEQLRHDGGVMGFFNTYINPGEISQISTSKIADSLDEISKATGNKAIYPDYIAPGSFTYTDENGIKQTVTISGKEMTETYQRTYGEKVASLYSALLSMKEFNTQDAATKAAILESAKSYASKLARASVSDYSEIPAYIKNKPENMSEAEAIVRQKLVGTTTLYTDLSIEQATFVAHLLDDILPEQGRDGVRKIQKLEAIAAADSRLSQQEQKSAMEDIIGENSTLEKYIKILEMGYDNDDFVESYRIDLDTEGENAKERTIKAFMKELGIPKAAATKLYEAYHPPKK